MSSCRASLWGGDGSRAGWGSGISVDQYIAQQLDVPTALRTLELGVRATTAEVRSRLSYLGPSQPLPPRNDPRAVFDELFSDFEREPSELQFIREQQRSVLDTVSKQFAAIRPRLTAVDQRKLEAHLSLVRDVERRLAMENIAEGCSAPNEPRQLDPDSEDDMPHITDLQIEMLTMALTCDLTRIVTLQFSNAQNHIRYPWLDSLGDGHSLSHAGPSNSDARSQWVTRERWLAGRFAYLLSRLEAVPEGDGTMLDNTIVLWINELAVGNTHSHINMPFLMAGSGGGYFRTRALHSVPRGPAPQ